MELFNCNFSLIAIWFFALGAVIGSFLNVVILRHESEKTLRGRSECPHCNKLLTWRELIPIFSYMFQRGRCSSCEHRISMQYPLVEFVTGIIFVLVFLNVIGTSTLNSYLTPLTLLKLLLELGIWSTLIVITVYDFRTKLIPDVFSYTFSALALCTVVLTFVGSQSLTSNLQPLTSFLAGPIYFFPFYVLWKVSHGRWIGLGDGKLALGIGWLLGIELGGTAILLAFWLGALVSLAIIGFQRIRAHFCPSNLEPKTSRLTLKSEVPFGPFMIISTLYVYLSGFSILTLIF